MSPLLGRSVKNASLSIVTPVDSAHQPGTLASLSLSATLVPGDRLPLRHGQVPFPTSAESPSGARSHGGRASRDARGSWQRREAAALVPRPRLHLIPFHGVLTPNAKLRPEIIPSSGAKQATSLCLAFRARRSAPKPPFRSDRSKSGHPAPPYRCDDLTGMVIRLSTFATPGADQASAARISLSFFHLPFERTGRKLREIAIAPLELPGLFRALMRQPNMDRLKSARCSFTLSNHPLPDLPPSVFPSISSISA
jgi:hypothetical protein